MWYYVDEGKERGPFDETQFDGLIAAGTIAPETLVWKEGLPTWLPLAQAQVGPDVCQVCNRVVGADQLINLEGENVCAACKPVALQRIREGVKPPPVNSRRRPVLVWVISLFYFITLPFALLSMALIPWISSGAIPISEAQRHYFQSQTALDYSFAGLAMLLNLSGAVFLFILRRQAFYCFAAVLTLSILNFAYQIMFKNWLEVISSGPGGIIPGLIGAAFSVGIIVAITWYAWRLKATNILR